MLPIDLDYSLPRLARFQDAREYLEEVQKHQRLAVELCEEHFTAAQGRQRRNCPARLTNTFNVGVKFGQRLFTTYPHVSDYILLKTQMGNENR